MFFFKSFYFCSVQQEVNYEKIFLLPFAILFVLISCKENCNSPAQSESIDLSDLPTYGLYIEYDFGPCDDDGNFTQQPTKIWLAFKDAAILNGKPCNFVEFQNIESGETIPFVLSVTNKWVYIYSYYYFPLIRTTALGNDAPHIWQPLWTRSFSNTSFDTSYFGVYPLFNIKYDSILKDTLVGIIFPKARFVLKYKVEDLGEAYFNLPKYFNKPVLVYGTKVTFQSIVTLLDTSLKHPRNFGIVSPDASKYNYSEFYFDNDRSAYIDKVEMKVYYLNKIGILWLWIKHKTLFGTKTYQYYFRDIIYISFGK